jgi:DNA-binding NtrC family response regulator
MAGMPGKILIADDERHIAEGLQMLLADDGYEVDMATDGKAAWELIESGGYGLVLADLRMPEIDGLELFSRMRERTSLRDHHHHREGDGRQRQGGDARGRVRLPREAAQDRPAQGADPKALEKFEVKQANRSLEERLANLSRFGDLIGQSEEMQQIYGTIEAAAPSSASMFIIGESGTGKELVARAIHDRSTRKKGPFVAINCAAFPREILENELFGHEKGAFTGALNEKPGCFELADGGTLFLDEVAEMEPDIQVKLLRALEQRSFRRLGGKKEITSTSASSRRPTSRSRRRSTTASCARTSTIGSPSSRWCFRRCATDAATCASSPRPSCAASPRRTVRSSRLLARGDRVHHEYRWPGNVRELKNADRARGHPRAATRSRSRDLRAHELISRGPRDPHPGRHLARAGRSDHHPEDLLLRQRRPPEGRRHARHGRGEAARPALGAPGARDGRRGERPLPPWARLSRTPRPASGGRGICGSHPRLSDPDIAQPLSPSPDGGARESPLSSMAPQLHPATVIGGFAVASALAATCCRMVAYGSPPCACDRRRRGVERRDWEVCCARRGHEVRTASSGSGGSKRARFPTRHVICDFFLPDLDGLEVLRRVRAMRTGSSSLS